MKRSKVITLFAMAGMVLSMASCGSTKSITEEEVGKESAMETSNAQSTTSANTEAAQFVRDGTIEEIVMVDESDIKITATELSYTDYDVRLNLTIENNSDRDLSFVSGSIGYGCNSVNGYMIQDGYMNADVLAGKKTNETVRFDLDELAVYGITEIADIQIGFKVTDDNYDTVYQGTAQVKTSFAATHDYEADTYANNLKSGAIEKLTGCSVDYYSDEILYDLNGLKILSEAVITNKDGEQTVLIEFENNSEELICGVISNIALNNMVVYSARWTSEAAAPQTRCVAGISPVSVLDEIYWDLLGISGIGKISFTFAGSDGAWGEVTLPQEVSITWNDEKSAVSDKGDEVYSGNGIRILSKGLVEDSASYSDDVHMLFLVENHSAEVMEIDDAYDSLAVNGYMTDYINSAVEIPAGKCGLVDVEIDGSSLQENGIAGMAEISEAELTFEIRDGERDDIAEPTVLIKY